MPIKAKHTWSFGLSCCKVLNVCERVGSEIIVHLQEDIPWEWEQIFTEVSSELLAESEKQENPEE